ncbi:cAMP-dependent protein kinase inhibitor gamma-like [Liolophura sinensis]|uniref:cAMP-dependent protein kinase inhibitor gamma-like n=1 Tax=Liolophura sinensis TaxID=3198878 RepID=UPI0031584D2D
MTEVDCAANLNEFINTGRTGRRNAVPDILDDKLSKVGTGNLAFDMEKLQCSDAPSESTSNNSSSPSAGAEGGADTGNSQGT